MPSDISPANRISVVIPLYNHAEYIGEAVRSVLGQTISPAEIIVVDDGSTDASAARMRALCEKYPQIIFWSQPNQGAHYTLNAGIHRATGEFVSILNSDDAYCPTRFEECLATLQDNPDAVAVAAGLTFIDASSAATSNDWYEKARSFYDEVQDLSLALIKGNFFVTTSNLFVRRSAFEEIGYFSPLRYTHDLDFCLRLLAYGKRFCFLDRPLLKYRVHGSNTIRENNAAIQVERTAVLAFYLYTAWLHRDREDKDWPGYVGRFMEIAERQSLDLLLPHFLGHLNSLPSPDLQFGSWTRDLQFRGYLRESAGAGRAPVGQSSGAASLLQDLQRLAEAQRSLNQELEKRDAIIVDQKAWISKLEQGKQWLARQREQLQKELETRDAVIADQKVWIGKLEEGKQWLAGQNEQLQKELEKRDAVIADQKAWIEKLEEGKQWLAARNEQLESEIDAIKRSRLWRILHAIGLNPGSRQ